MRYWPNHSAFAYTDCCAVEVNAVRARFRRPDLDEMGFGYVSPGARIRFVTGAPRLELHFRHSAWVTRQDAYNGVGAVLVDGAWHRDYGFGGAWDATGEFCVPIVFANARQRLVDVLMPYAASLDFLGVDLPAGGTS